MTVGELITMLQDLDVPSDTPVWVEDDYVREGASEAAQLVSIPNSYYGPMVILLPEDR